MERIITGFHAIEERVLKAKETGKTKNICIRFSKPGPRVKKILAEAKEAGIQSSSCDEKTLDSIVQVLPETSRDHRGIVMKIKDESTGTAQVDFSAWIAEAKKLDQEKKRLVIVLDSVTDPHNVGAIIRSCDQFGVSLVVLPDHRGTKDIYNNEVVARSSAGSVAWVPVSIVTNLVRAVQELKEAGFWIFGADAGGTSLNKIKFPAKSVIVMGSEGSGMAKLLSRQCDEIVSIPTCGKIDSLNVSVAAGVLLYESYRQRM